MSRYVVTGGCGFLGSHLCDALIQRDDSVICIDNMVTGSVDNVSHLLSHPNFKLVMQDIFHFPYSDGHFDAIFHLASPAAPEDIRKHQAMTIAANWDGTDRLLTYTKSWNAKFLFVSTMKVHGDCERVDSYIKGKRAGEKLCLESGAKVARLASVYGPRMAVNDSRVIPVFITRALRNEPLSVWNGGSQIDSFCYVDDIVRALITFMDSDHSGVTEFGNPQGISIMDLAKMIIRLTGSRSEITTNESIMVVNECHRIPDLTHAGLDFEWEPIVTLSEGLLRTIDYFVDTMKLEKVDYARTYHAGVSA